MKRLILLRHARAAAKTDEDFSRALAPEGRVELGPVATYLHARLAEDGGKIDLALVSPSLRTRETWDLTRALLPDVPTFFEEDIYEAEPEDLLDILHDVEAQAKAQGPAAGSVGTVILVGHNPGITTLALELVGTGDARMQAELARGMPPASAVILDFDIESWPDLAPGGARLVAFVSPASLVGAAAPAKV